VNHSCEPNAGVHFPGSNVIELVSLRKIQPGEEVSISYVDTDLPHEGRQELLYHQYGIGGFFLFIFFSYSFSFLFFFFSKASDVLVPSVSKRNKKAKRTLQLDDAQVCALTCSSSKETVFFLQLSLLFGLFLLVRLPW
jgi:hypothetical protein